MTEQIHMYDEPDYECSQQTDELWKAKFEVFCGIEMPKKDNTNPHFKTKYSSLDAYGDTLIPLLQKHGLCLVFNKGYLRSINQEILCMTIMHVKSGQWEKHRSIFVKCASTNNEYQEDGKARTYQKRYMLRDVFFMYDNDDDDAESLGKDKNNGKPIEPFYKWISKENVAHIRSLLIGIGDIDRERRICDHYKIDALYKLPESKYEEVIKIIKS